MNSSINERFEEVIAEKIEALAELDINDSMHGAATEDISKLINASVAFDKADAEYTRKDDERVIEKERLALEKMKQVSAAGETEFRQMMEEKQFRHQKRKDIVDSVLKGLGYVGTGIAFVLTLGFEETNSVSSLAGRQAIGTVLKNLKR